jgi:MoxR-like ATPase
MRHRVVLSYEALADNISSDELLNRILERIQPPEVPLHEHPQRRAYA